MRTIHILILCLFVVSCDSHKEHKSSPVKTEKTQKMTSRKDTPTEGYRELDLQPIVSEDFPSGCSCYFGSDSSEFSESNYIFVFNYESDGVMNIGGKDVFMKENNIIQNIYPNDGIRVFQNSTYKVTINMKAGEQSGDETVFYKGKMTILVKRTGETYVRSLFGECGC